MPDPPDRGKNVMRSLEGSVIESLDRSPVRMSRVVQQGTGAEREQVTFPDDDAERIAIHIVLLPRHLIVIVTVKPGKDQHRESPGRVSPAPRDQCSDQRPKTMSSQLGCCVERIRFMMPSRQMSCPCTNNPVASFFIRRPWTALDAAP